VRGARLGDLEERCIGSPERSTHWLVIFFTFASLEIQAGPTNLELEQSK
jgi:hypothetical protein